MVSSFKLGASSMHRTAFLPSRYARFPEKRSDIWLALLAFFINLFGLLMIFESSNVAAFREFSDKYYFVREQAFACVAGLVSMLVVARISYKQYYYLSVPVLIGSLVSLIAVFIPGIGVHSLGASRWIRIGGIGFQPSELAKLSLIIYLSSWLAQKEQKRFLAFVILLGLIVGLVVIQPDMGTAIILAMIFLTIYFLSGASLKHFAIIIPFFVFAGVALAFLAPYRFARLQSFLNPDRDPLASSYHIRQILISLGSGGIWGVGLGESKQKYQYLPEASTDSIFAIIGEEFGYAGSILFIIVVLSFLYRIYQIAYRAPDKRSYLLASGVMAFFAFQYMINLGAMVALFPLTGVPLPFISYGGTHLVICYVALGILLNISKHMDSATPCRV